MATAKVTLEDLNRFFSARVTIDDLPDEMLLEIFEKLSLFDLVVNCSETCPEWKEIGVAESGPHMVDRKVAPKW